MAGRGAPTYLKRQKEQKRAARALAKRVAKQSRRNAAAEAALPEQALDDGVPTEASESVAQDPESGDDKQD